MNTEPVTGGARRRTDPGRRDRIVTATIDVVAERGVAGLTHRAVATAAGVPLGSITYHLGSWDALLDAALRSAADSYNGRLRAWIAALPADADLAEALAELALTDIGNGRRRTIVEYELYLAALRRPALRATATAWIAEITALVAQRTDPVTARVVTATLDGLIFESLLADPPPTRADLLPVLRRMLGDPGPDRDA